MTKKLVKWEEEKHKKTKQCYIPGLNDTVPIRVTMLDDKPRGLAFGKMWYVGDRLILFRDE